MTETLFVFDELNYRDCQTAYRGEGNQEYYLGDYSIEAGSVIDVRAERKAVGSCSIITLKSKTRLFFRRSWSHIREDGTDVTVLWLVKRGRLCVSHQSGYSVAGAGDFLLTRSTTPFFVECQTDGESHEVLHVVAPSHLVRRFIAHDVPTGFSIAAGKRELTIAERMFADVFEDQGDLSEDSSRTLVEAAISILCSAMQKNGAITAPRQTVSDRRLSEVLRFVDLHISDPKLSATSVAKGCGISPRYLSFLLKVRGTPFSTLVWEQRLKMAARWMASAGTRDISISEIAYRVGFKSPAHFSRMFKRAFNMSPREFRAEAVAPDARSEKVQALQ